MPLASCCAEDARGWAFGGPTLEIGGWVSGGTELPCSVSVRDRVQIVDLGISTMSFDFPIDLRGILLATLDLGLEVTVNVFCRAFQALDATATIASRISARD